MSRLRTAFATCVLLFATSGCAKHVDACREARNAAGNAWNAYVAALERSRSGATAAQHAAGERLGADLQQRFAPAAQQTADEHYPRNSEGWSRAYRIAYDDACARDDECRAWKDASAVAAATLADLEARIPLARAALRAVSGDPAPAVAAARAVPPHLEYPQLEQAQELTLAAAKHCPAPNAVTSR